MIANAVISPKMIFIGAPTGLRNYESPFSRSARARVLAASSGLFTAHEIALKPPACNVVPIKEARRAPVRKADLVATAVWYGLVLYDADAH